VGGIGRRAYFFLSWNQKFGLLLVKDHTGCCVGRLRAVGAGRKLLLKVAPGWWLVWSDRAGHSSVAEVDLHFSCSSCPAKRTGVRSASQTKSQKLKGAGFH
jgi:hypothetical protein